MNLDFSDDQKLQAEARKFFDKEGGLLLARKAAMTMMLKATKNFGKKLLI